MGYLIALGLGLVAWKIFAPRGASLGSSGYDVQLQSFEPKVAAEILRNLTLYTPYVDFAPRADGFSEVHLKYEGDVPTGPSEDVQRAFHTAILWNDAGLAILGPASMWTAQPWEGGAARLLGVPANDAQAIAKLTEKGSPWAVIVRVPGKLTKYLGADAASFSAHLSASDIA